MAGSRSILVADDDPHVREILRAHLEELGHRVQVAEDGEEAIALAENHHFDLAILDVTMPKCNGWEVARRLRSAPETAHIRQLMLSGIGEEVLEAALSVLGGDLALDKPFELEDLEAAINKLVDP